MYTIKYVYIHHYPEWMWQMGRSSMVGFLPEIDKASLQVLFLARFKGTSSRNYHVLHVRGFLQQFPFQHQPLHCNLTQFSPLSFWISHDITLLVAMVTKGQSKVHTGSSQVVSHLKNERVGNRRKSVRQTAWECDNNRTYPDLIWIFIIFTEYQDLIWFDMNMYWRNICALRQSNMGSWEIPRINGGCAGFYGGLSSMKKEGFFTNILQGGAPQL